MRYQFSVRSLTTAMRLSHGGAYYCYAPLIEFYSAMGTTWPGDSGAWSLANQFSEWAAVVVGADTLSTFAIDARDVSDWLDNCGIVSKGNWSIY
jgi:hypothetical protein